MPSQFQPLIRIALFLPLALSTAFPLAGLRSGKNAALSGSGGKKSSQYVFYGDVSVRFPYSSQ